LGFLPECQKILFNLQLGCACRVLLSVLVHLFWTAGINKTGLGDEEVNAKISWFPAMWEGGATTAAEGVWELGVTS